MKVSKPVLVCTFVAFGSGVALAQDPAKVDPTHYKVVTENASVRVLKVDYAAGSKSPMHQHPDAIVVPLVSSKVRFTMPDGKTQDSDLANESAMYLPAGTHSSANVGTERVNALLIEFKGAKPGTAALPTSRAGMAMKVLAEGPRGVVYRSTAEPGFQEPAGSTARVRSGRHRARPDADGAHGRRQASQDGVGARRRAVHWARRGARREEHQQQAGGLRDCRDQVAVLGASVAAGGDRRARVSSVRHARRSADDSKPGWRSRRRPGDHGTDVGRRGHHVVVPFPRKSQSLLFTWRSIAKRSILSAVVSRSRKFGKSAISSPSSQNAMRPSRCPGVFALTMTS